MKINSLTKLLSIALFLIAGLIISCEKKSDTTTAPEQENTADASSMDLAMSNMHHYNDSCVTAKNHSSPHLHHYDSIYHYHDSTYLHHHHRYHHGDTTHHHTGFHHSTVQHHQYDSISHAHHKIVH